MARVDAPARGLSRRRHPNRLLSGADAVLLQVRFPLAKTSDLDPVIRSYAQRESGVPCLLLLLLEHDSLAATGEDHLAFLCVELENQDGTALEFVLSRCFQSDAACLAGRPEV